MSLPHKTWVARAVAPLATAGALIALLGLALACRDRADRQEQAPAPSPAPAQPAAAVPREPPPPAAPASPPVAAEPAPPPSAETLAHGGELYGRICAVCHGAQGEGYKADNAPALAHPDYLASVSDAFMVHAIAEGRTGTVMSAWSDEHAGPLKASDIQAVVAFIRSWQKQPSVKLDESPTHGNVFAGASIFSRACASCHGPNGPNLRLMNPQLLEHASLGFLRHAVRSGRPGTPMAAFETTLGAQGVEDVVAYLSALPKSPSLRNAGVVPQPPAIRKGSVPLNPKGREPVGFEPMPKYTKVAVVARELKKKARMTLIDARAPSDYAQQHIAGAVNVPFYDPSPYFDSLPRDSWLVCYCGCPHAESGALALKLSQAGFTKVTVLDEGLGEWQAKGHAVRSGPKP